MEAVADFIFLASKIVVDGYWSHKIKRLAPWKKSYDKPRQCIKKQKHHFVNKVRVKVITFPIVMYTYENWTIMKAEHQRIDALKL